MKAAITETNVVSLTIEALGNLEDAIHGDFKYQDSDFEDVKDCVYALIEHYLVERKEAGKA